MEQKEKDLLLKDLCARLSYGVKGKCEIDASYDTSFDTIFQLHKFDAILEGIKEDLLFVTPLIEDKNEQEFANEEVADGIDVLDFKPYLRPLSSMTEEEKKELKFMCDIGPETLTDSSWINGEFGLSVVYKNKASICVDAIDWLNKNMFDFRGLIDKGHALSTEEYNPYKDNLI